MATTNAYSSTMTTRQSYTEIETELKSTREMCVDLTRELQLISNRLVGEKKSKRTLERSAKKLVKSKGAHLQRELEKEKARRQKNREKRALEKKSLQAEGLMDWILPTSSQDLLDNASDTVTSMNGVIDSFGEILKTLNEMLISIKELGSRFSSILAVSNLISAVNAYKDGRMCDVALCLGNVAVHYGVKLTDVTSFFFNAITKLCSTIKSFFSSPRLATEGFLDFVNDSFTPLAAFLTLVSGVATSFKSINYKAIVNFLKDFSHISRGAKAFAEAGILVKNFVLNTYYTYICGQNLHQITYNEKYPHLDKLLDMRRILCSPDFDMKWIDKEKKVCFMILELSRRMEDMYLSAIKAGDYTTSAILRVSLTKLTPFLEAARKSPARSFKARTRPFSLYLFGTHGTGKSVAALYLRNFLYKNFCNKNTWSPANCYFVRNSENEYWDGYNGQPIVVVDDIYQKKDSVTAPNLEFFETIRMLNDMPYPLHMATLEEKKNSLFESEFVIATSNVRIPNAVSLANPAAVRRRWDLCVDVKVKPEYALADGQLDEKKCQTFNPHVYECSLYDMKSEGGPVLKRGLSLYELCTILRTRVLETEKDRSHLNTDIYKDLDIESPESAQGMLDFFRLSDLDYTILGKQFADLCNKIANAEDPTPGVDLGDLEPDDDDDDNGPDAGNGNDEDGNESDGSSTSYHSGDLRPQGSTRRRVQKRYAGSSRPISPIRPRRVSPNGGSDSDDDGPVVSRSPEELVDDLENFILNEGALTGDASLYSKTRLGRRRFVNDVSRYGSIIGRIKTWMRDPNGEYDNFTKTELDSMSTRSTCIDVLLLLCSGAAAAIGGYFLTSMWGCAYKRRKTLEGFVEAKMCSWPCSVCSIIPRDEIFTAMSPLGSREAALRILSFLKSRPDLVANDVMDPYIYMRWRGFYDELLDLRAESREVNTRGVPRKFSAESREIQTRGSPRRFVSEQMIDQPTDYKFSDVTIPNIAKKNSSITVDAPVYSNGQLRAEIGDHVQLEQWQSIVKTNVIRITEPSHINAVFVTGRILLVPRHFLADLERKNAKLFKINNPGQKEGTWVSLDDCKVHHCTAIDGTVVDLTLISLPVVFPSRRRIVNLFHEASSREKLGEGEFVLCGLREVEGVVSYNNAHFASIGLTEKEIQYNDVDGCAAAHSRIHVGVAYRAHTRPGDCGNLVYCQNKLIAGKILGMHVAGDGKLGLGIVVSREFLLRNLTDTNFSDHDFIDAKIPFTSMRAEMEACVTPVVFDSNELPSLTEVGDCLSLGYTTGPRMPTKTTLQPSAIADCLPPPTTKPAHLHSVLIAGEEVNPMVRGLKKIMGIQKEIPNELLQLASDDVFRELNAIAKKTGWVNKILNYEEAIEGTDNEDFMRAINRTSSPGFPYCMNNKGPGKREYLGYDTFEFPEDLRNDVENLIDNCRRNIRPDVCFTATLKDERRPIEKVDEGKTRVFCAGPMHFTIAFRQYFLSMISFVMENRIENEMGVGTNVFGLDWHRTGEALSRFGPNVFAGDFTNYDGNLFAKLSWAIFDVIVRVIRANGDLSSEEERVMRVLWEEISNPRILVPVNGPVCEIVQATHSQPSGNPMTTVKNCLANKLLMRLAYLILKVHLEMPVVCDFKENVSLQCYGDDNVLNVSAKVPWFTQNNVTEALAAIGMTYTDETKSGQRIDFKPLSEVKYLKRSFVKDSSGYWIAPLDFDVIVEMMKWVRGKEVNAATLLNVDVAMRELALHPRDVFEELAQRINDVCAFRNLYPVIRTFDEYRSELDHERFNRGSTSFADPLSKSDVAIETRIPEVFRDDLISRLRSRVAVFTAGSSDQSHGLEDFSYTSSVENRITAQTGNNQQIKSLKTECDCMSQGLARMQIRKEKERNKNRAVCDYCQTLECSWNDHNNLCLIRKCSCNLILDNFVAEAGEDVPGDVSDNSQPEQVRANLQTDVNFDTMVEMPSNTENRGIEDITRHEYTDLVSRPVFIGSFQWSGDDIVVTDIFSSSDPTREVASWNIPMDMINASALLKQKLNNFQFLKSDVELVFQANATPMQQGKIIFVFHPFAANVTPFVTDNCQWFSSLTTYPHAELNLQTGNSTTLRIAYTNFLEAYNLETPTFQFGKVSAYILAPLRDSISSPSITINVKGALVNPVLSVPTNMSVLSIPEVADAHVKELNKSLQLKRQPQKGLVAGLKQSGRTGMLPLVDFLKQEGYRSLRGLRTEGGEGESTGPVSRVADKISNVAFGASRIPMLPSFASAGAQLLGWVARGVSGVASVFGWSKPTNLEQVHRFQLTQGANMVNVEGIDNSVCIGQIQDNAIDPTSFSVTQEDEMSHAYIKKRPNTLKRYTITKDQFAGQSKLFSFANHPIQPFQAHSGTYYLGSLGFLASCYGYWRGGLNFTLEVIKTRFHAGRFIMIYFPYATTDGDLPDTFTDDLMTTNYNMLYDLQPADTAEGSVKYDFNAFFSYAAGWAPCLTKERLTMTIDPIRPIGMIGVYAYTDLVSPDTVSTDIDFLLSVSGADDLAFAFPQRALTCGYNTEGDAERLQAVINTNDLNFKSPSGASAGVNLTSGPAGTISNVSITQVDGTNSIVNFDPPLELAEAIQGASFNVTLLCLRRSTGVLVGGGDGVFSPVFGASGNLTGGTVVTNGNWVWNQDVPENKNIEFRFLNVALAPTTSNDVVDFSSFRAEVGSVAPKTQHRSMEDTTVGEYSLSLRPLTRRFGWNCSSQTNLVYNPLFVSIDDNGHFGYAYNATFIPATETWQQYIGHIFRFHAGGSRVKFVSSSTSGMQIVKPAVTGIRSSFSYVAIPDSVTGNHTQTVDYNPMLEVTIPYYSSTRATPTFGLTFPDDQEHQSVGAVDYTGRGTGTSNIDMYTAGADDFSYHFMVGPVPMRNFSRSIISTFS